MNCTLTILTSKIFYKFHKFIFFSRWTKRRLWSRVCSSRAGILKPDSSSARYKANWGLGFLIRFEKLYKNLFFLEKYRNNPRKIVFEELKFACLKRNLDGPCRPGQRVHCPWNQQIRPEIVEGYDRGEKKSYWIAAEDHLLVKNFYQLYLVENVRTKNTILTSIFLNLYKGQ